MVTEKTNNSKGEKNKKIFLILEKTHCLKYSYFIQFCALLILSGENYEMDTGR